MDLFLELQNNNNIINLNNEKILFILQSDFNLLNNIKIIKYYYNNYHIIILNKNNEKIYNHIENLSLSNITIFKIEETNILNIIKEILLKILFLNIIFLLII